MDKAATAENLGGGSPYVLLCEHASNTIPPSYNGLGLPDSELGRHIAWDIGAAALARLLSRALDAPLFLSGYSRLLIDCNRPLGTPTSIPVRSEDTDIPGNAAVSDAERGRRAEAFFHPFQRLVGAELDRRTAAAISSIVLGVHSFTPVFQGVSRPWQAGVLYAGAGALAGALIEGLSRAGLTVGDNEPYRIEAEHDHTVPVHGDGRGIPAVLLEVRQDLLATQMDAEGWARLLTPVLRDAEGHARVSSR